MRKIHFSVQIDAPVEVVWDTMLSDETYRQWADSFSPGSYYKGSWDEGSKILFLGPQNEGDKEDGMVGRIIENRKYEFVSIEMMGIMANGVEDITSKEATKWSGGFENYTFNKNKSGTELLIDIDVESEFKEMFENMWPKALQVLKNLAESKK